MLNQPILDVRCIAKEYPSTKGVVRALDDISFSVQKGQIVSVVGPSGAGKTTLLRCLSGLMQPTAGEIIFEGKPINGTPAGFAAVFQDYGRSLLPWLSARENVTLPLRSRGMSRSDARARAETALATVGLEGRERVHPWQMSGGMQQRVAVARALACEPQLLFMDEPFASLDAQTRMDLEDLVRHVHDEVGTTVLVVTHDIDEAIYLSDKVVILSKPPAKVLKEVDVLLGADRHQTTTKEKSEFSSLRHQILNMVRRDPFDSEDDR